MSSSSFKVAFYLKRNQINKSGKATIMVRITIDGTRTQFSSKLEVEPEMWSPRANKAIGRSINSSRVNSLLDDIKSSIISSYYELRKTKGLVSGEDLKALFLGESIGKSDLLQIFKEHNRGLIKMVGVSITKDTLMKYQRAHKRLEAYIKQEYKASDVKLKDINYNFIVGFENFLRADCKYHENTVGKVMQYFKRIITIARNNGLIVSDPFLNYKIRFKKVDRGYLSEKELQCIIEKKMFTERLEQVKDIFIFACFTGLAYVDVSNLRKHHIKKSFDGSLWIMTKRQKTDVSVNVSLLEIPLHILKKYENKLQDGKVLPCLSNQKLNTYLKEIADVCGINKNLTFHLARHCTNDNHLQYNCLHCFNFR